CFVYSENRVHLRPSVVLRPLEQQPCHRRNSLRIRTFAFARQAPAAKACRPNGGAAAKRCRSIGVFAAGSVAHVLHLPFGRAARAVGKVAMALGRARLVAAAARCRKAGLLTLAAGT